MLKIASFWDYFTRARFSSKFRHAMKSKAEFSHPNKNLYLKIFIIKKLTDTGEMFKSEREYHAVLKMKDTNAMTHHGAIFKHVFTPPSFMECSFFSPFRELYDTFDSALSHTRRSKASEKRRK